MSDITLNAPRLFDLGGQIAIVACRQIHRAERQRDHVIVDSNFGVARAGHRRNGVMIMAAVCLDGTREPKK